MGAAHVGSRGPRPSHKSISHTVLDVRCGWMEEQGRLRCCCEMGNREHEREEQLVSGTRSGQMLEETFSVQATSVNGQGEEMFCL